MSESPPAPEYGWYILSPRDEYDPRELLEVGKLPAARLPSEAWRSRTGRSVIAMGWTAATPGSPKLTLKDRVGMSGR